MISKAEKKIMEMGPLNVANPIEFAAEEYLCAMKVLDELGAPRFHQDNMLSIVGRIKALKNETNIQKG